MKDEVASKSTSSPQPCHYCPTLVSNAIRSLFLYRGWYFEFRLSIKLGVDTVNFIAKKDDSHFTSTTSFDQHHLQFSF